MRYEKPGKNNKAVERIYTGASMLEKNIRSDLGLVYVAANFAEILRQSPYTTDLQLSHLISYAKTEKLDDDCISMMEKFDQLQMISQNTID